MIRIEGLRKSYGEVDALNGVDLRVEEEEVFAVLGPNGAGKTTLFNVISGYVPPSAGSIHIAGTDMTGASQTAVAALGVGRTFQTPKLIGDISVLDNVLIGINGRTSLWNQVREAVLFAPSAAKNRDRARDVLDRFSLGDVAHLEASSLPLGSQKIVEVCRALVANPSLLLLDEPAAGLGKDDVEQLVNPLKTWIEVHGTSVVIIEHDLELVTDLCQDVAVLHLGEIIARGTPAECMSHPQVIEAYLGAGVAENS